MIAPGRVFRNEEVDASHEHTFYQLEGMMMDRERLGRQSDLLHEDAAQRDLPSRRHRCGFVPAIFPSSSPVSSWTSNA